MVVERNMPHRRTVAVVVVVAAVAVAAVSGAIVPVPVEASACWRPPVDAPVNDPFRDPGCPWCPGNRGMEYATRPGQPVVAVAAGRVTFAGSVAGTNYLVVDVGGGRRITYGRLIELRPATGDAVLRDQVIGRADAAFHFGVRAGEQYVDPAPFLGRLVGRPRLVPTDGSPAPAPPPPVLRCRADSPTGVGAIVPGPARIFDRSTVR